MTVSLKRLAWITDPHLNFVDLAQWDYWVAQVQLEQPQALLISGDISEAEDLQLQLRRVLAAFGVPVYFVLGNHDFYHGSIASARQAAGDLLNQDNRLVYLTGGEPILLSRGWALCGDDGWADARLGDYYRSPVRMNDFHLISDLASLDAEARYQYLQQQGAASADRLQRQLERAALHAQQLIVLAHVPPFRESCWYDGQHSDDDWAPFFTNDALGRMLREFCHRQPEHQVWVLCGHTHHAGRSRIAQNLTVWTGSAEYGQPQVNAVLDLAEGLSSAVDWSYTATPSNSDSSR